MCSGLFLCRDIAIETDIYLNRRNLYKNSSELALHHRFLSVRHLATSHETCLNFPEAKFYLQTCVSGGKVPHLSVLSRELHAFSLRVTRYTAGGDKSIR